MENKKIEGSETLLNKAKEITEKCRKLGLANGAALGHHSGFADEVADCIDNLLHRIAELEKYKMLPTKASKIFKTPSTTFPRFIYVQKPIAIASSLVGVSIPVHPDPYIIQNASL